jgi:hypothetical protein
MLHRARGCLIVSRQEERHEDHRRADPYLVTDRDAASGLHRKVSKFTAEECLKEMDEAGVDAALIHPPYSWDPTSNQLALERPRNIPTASP